MAYNQLLDRVDALAESNARLLVVELAHAATVPEATSDEEDEKPIPLHPKQTNYKMIKHWMPDVYNGLQHQKGGTPRPNDTNVEDPLSSIFWEDQSGCIIPPKK